MTRAVRRTLALGLAAALIALGLLALSSPAAAEDPPPVVTTDDVRQAGEDATDGKITPEQYRAVVKQWMAQGKPTERPQKPETPPAEQQQPQQPPPQGDPPQQDPPPGDQPPITFVEEPVQRSEELQFSPQLQRSPGRYPWYLDDRRQIDGTEQFGTHDIPCPDSFWCDYEEYKKSATGMKDTRSKAQFDIDVREQYRAWKFASEGNPRFDPTDPNPPHFDLGQLSRTQLAQYCGRIGGTLSGTTCQRPDDGDVHTAHTPALDRDEVERNIAATEQKTGIARRDREVMSGALTVREVGGAGRGCIDGVIECRTNFSVRSFQFNGVVYTITQLNYDTASGSPVFSLSFDKAVPPFLKDNLILRVGETTLHLVSGTLFGRPKIALSFTLSSGPSDFSTGTTVPVSLTLKAPFRLGSLPE